MYTYKIAAFALGIALVATTAIAQPQYELGIPVTSAEIEAWDIAIKPDGEGLPPGQGSVAQGEKVYRNQCASCHGDQGQGGEIGTRLVGGFDTLYTDRPVKTIGSYWPYATTVFDYIRRTMPFYAPQSLTAEDTYAVSAYVLYLNDIIGEDAVLNADTLPQIEMPNRDGFIRPDPRPDVHSILCERSCE